MNQTEKVNDVVELVIDETYSDESAIKAIEEFKESNVAGIIWANHNIRASIKAMYDVSNGSVTFL